MSVTLNLDPELEAGLMAQAQSAGMTLDEFLTRQLETISSATAVLPADFPGAGDAESWERELDAWLDSFPQEPVLSDASLQRENWYPDRW